MINQVTLVGRVGKDPEIRYTTDNKAVAMFSIATNELGNDKTTWHNVKAWEKRAELCEQYVKKGDLLYISGRIEYSEKDGKYYTAIVAHTLKFLSSKGGNQSAVSNKEPPKPPTGQKPQSTATADDLGDDDILF